MYYFTSDSSSLGAAVATVGIVMKFFQIVISVSVGLALLLPVFFGLDGVLYSMPSADLLTFIIAAILIRNIFGELKQQK